MTRTWPAAVKKLVFGLAVMPVDAPIEKRLEFLSQYISPKPGQILEILPTQARDQSAIQKNIGKLYGEIKISPPKGSCFVVTVDVEKRDIEVCKPSTIKWRLEDMDQQTGNVSWKIKTSAEDFGTEIKWPTHYSIARTLPLTAKFYHANSTPVFIKSCTPTLGRSDGGLRRVTLSLFDGKQWIIKFPDKDTVIPPLEPPKPKIIEAPKSGGGGHGEPSKKEEAGGHGEPAKDKPKNQAAVDTTAISAAKEETQEVEQWTINTRRGFEMSVDHFKTDGSSPPGKAGKCRYVYDYVPGDTSLGRIECHHSDQFLYFYAFLRCMKPIIPKSN